MRLREDKNECFCTVHQITSRSIQCEMNANRSPADNFVASSRDRRIIPNGVRLIEQWDIMLSFN